MHALQKKVFLPKTILKISQKMEDKEKYVRSSGPLLYATRTAKVFPRNLDTMGENFGSWRFQILEAGYFEIS